MDIPLLPQATSQLQVTRPVIPLAPLLIRLGLGLEDTLQEGTLQEGTLQEGTMLVPLSEQVLLREQVSRPVRFILREGFRPVLC